MENFSDLLNHYIRRAGISDTELARAVGVSRQTIFRWREGATGRPRQREDVLAMARKLRLIPEEQDRLLLAAGFRPEGDTVGEFGPEAEAQRSEGAEEQRSRGAALSGGFAREQGSDKVEIVEEAGWWPTRRRHWGGVGLLVSLIAVTVVVMWRVWPWLQPGQTLPPRLLTAAPGKSLVLITHFANYAGEQAGYNVAGRLAEALEQEVGQIEETAISLAIWPEPVSSRALALEVGRTVSATLVIYGEYDAGRVVVKFAHPPDQTIFADPALQQHVLNLEDLSSAINGNLPEQVRALVLIALGQIYVSSDQADLARPLLIQAHRSLADDPAITPETRAVANFYLGLSYQHAATPDLDRAIGAYDEAIAAWPELISARLNRLAAYEARNQAGDLERALADAETVVKAAPDWAAAYNNRASIRLRLGGQANLTRALADLNQALVLEPDFPEAYLNRAMVHFGQGLSMAQLQPDLNRALELRPAYGSALNLLCWGYALEQQAETALPYCQQAVAAAPDEPLFQDSRGIAYALLGDYPAAQADFEQYASWLASRQPGEMWQRDLMRRREWIAALKRGDNPFTADLLATLRREFSE